MRTLSDVKNVIASPFAKSGEKSLVSSPKKPGEQSPMPADKHLRERDLLSYLWDIMSKKFSLIFPFSRFTQINSIFPLWLGTLAITGFFDGYLQHFSGKSKFESPHSDQPPPEISYFRGAFYIQKARHASLPLLAYETCCAAAAMEKQRENTEIIGLVSAKTVPIPHIGWRQWADSSRQCRSPGCGGLAGNRERHRCHCPQRRRPRERRR